MSTGIKANCKPAPMWQLHKVTSTGTCILPGQRCNLQQVWEGWTLEAKMPWRFVKEITEETTEERER